MLQTLCRHVDIAEVVCREDTDDLRLGASLDQKMRRLIRDKGESASLALDGALPERNEVSINIQAFLDDLTRHWHEPLDTLDEADLEQSLLHDLHAAQRSGPCQAEMFEVRSTSDVPGSDWSRFRCMSSNVTRGRISSADFTRFTSEDIGR